MRFKGKSGPVMWLALAMDLGLLVLYWRLSIGSDSRIGLWGLVVTLAAVAAVIVWFMARNYITVTDTEVRVCLGPTTSTVRIDSVISAKSVFNMTASSGASAQRVQIVYREDGREKVMYVSPADRDGFIDAVQGRARGCDTNIQLK